MYTIHSLKLVLEDLLRTSCPNDDLRMSLRRPYKAGELPWDKDFCMNIILLKLSPQHSRLSIRKEGIRITWLKLNSKTYIFFIEDFIKFYLIFINLISFFHHNSLISQQNWLYIKIKNICHQLWNKAMEV